MISQTVRNESVRFGRYIDIDVIYKILRLEVLKLVPILHYPACFIRGCLEAILSKNTLRPLGVNMVSNKFGLFQITMDSIMERLIVGRQTNTL
jgi:hypothetical protein